MIATIYSIEIRGMYAGKECVIKLMDGTHVLFMLSDGLQKQFEAEMKAAIDKKKKRGRVIRTHK